jgi:hypothetical protein
LFTGLLTSMEASMKTGTFFGAHCVEQSGSQTFVEWIGEKSGEHRWGMGQCHTWRTWTSIITTTSNTWSVFMCGWRAAAFAETLGFKSPLPHELTGGLRPLNLFRLLLVPQAPVPCSTMPPNAVRGSVSARGGSD